MEVYTPGLELIGVLEKYKSIVWEDKAFTAGSFSVDALLDEDTRPLLTEDNIIWFEGTTAGIIEHYEKGAESSGTYITVKGRLLTGILERRILWHLYNLSGPAPTIMEYLVEDCCINPTRGNIEARKIPGLVIPSATVGGTNIQKQVTGGYLLDVLEEIGRAYKVAFGIRFNPKLRRMEFWTRPCADRSVHQSLNEHVFYSTELDDVLSSAYSYNSIGWRNVALVAGEGEGVDRKLVVVEEDISHETDIPVMPPAPTLNVTITLSVDPAGGGTASGGGRVEVGVKVSVTAYTASGYAFVEWRENGQAVSKNRTYTFTALVDRALTAVFEKTYTEDDGVVGTGKVGTARVA